MFQKCPFIFHYVSPFLVCEHGNLQHSDGFEPHHHGIAFNNSMYCCLQTKIGLNCTITVFNALSGTVVYKSKLRESCMYAIEEKWGISNNSTSMVIYTATNQEKWWEKNPAFIHSQWNIQNQALRGLKICTKKFRSQRSFQAGLPLDIWVSLN